MAIQNRSKTLIFILLIIVSFYSLWIMGLKEIVYNYRTRSVTISDLPEPKEFHLKKYDAQSWVYGMELEITGYTDGDVYLLFGPEKGKYQQQVRLKKGSIQYDFARDWYAEDCYLYLNSEKPVRGNLKIDYRFYGSIK